MNRSMVLRLVCAIAITQIATLSQALPSGHFAPSSRLAQGHWVKIAVSESGVYEISREQLAQMGFSDPSRVQVYGYGGKVMSDVLNASQPDDLSQVPVMRRNDKILFYAMGPVQMALNWQREQPVFTRLRNTYTNQGYYLLTDNTGEANRQLTQAPYSANARNEVGTSYDYMMHESEERSLSFTGSELLGENITQGNRNLTYSLTNMATDSAYLTTRIAAKVVRASKNDTKSEVKGRFRCYLTGDGKTLEAPYDETTGLVTGATRDYTFYETGESTVKTLMPGNNGQGTLRYTVTETTGKGLMEVAVLDYFIFTYLHHNRLENTPQGQTLMGYISTTADDRLTVTGDGDIHVWDITDGNNPIDMEVMTDNEQTSFTPGAQSAPRQYIAFDAKASLMQIDSFQAVDNQDLHSMSVPDMLIITNEAFMPQAERVAQLHRDHDGMDVAVVDQELIFNEFSSGAPSALAYRLLCKMLYDRDQSKFKYLLLFGHSSFDNRGLVSGKKNRLMCYETALSNYDDNSHVIEDYFGYLADNSGTVMSADSLKIGIGRMPCSSVVEAKSDVDKLYEYVLSPDYGPWRNNYCVWSEKSTDNEKLLHEKQADGVAYLIDNDLKTGMMVDKAFVGMFPKNVTESYLEESKKTIPEATKHIADMLVEGQYFATYVGHARPVSFTNCGMWMASNVRATGYNHWPIMTNACCDVARFDSDEQGIAELMFHKRDGGAIALFTTARQVYANSNDRLNRAFVRAMFSSTTGQDKLRLGDIYRTTKLDYGRVSNSNKLNFLLLGDPALQVNYPKPRFAITRLNQVTDIAGASVTVEPLQRLNIEAQVLNDRGAVNTAFNGDATISLYDAKRAFISVPGTGTHEGETHTCYYPQELLARVDGRVTDGVFTGSIVVPRSVRVDTTGTCTLSLYAHRDGTDEMVNGRFDRILIDTNADGSQAITDTEAPVIEAFYLDDRTAFEVNAQVGPEATLNIHATDNTAFNIQQLSPGGNVSLRLDHGKVRYDLINNYATISDEGHSLNITMPITNLQTGRHTLEFSVSDVCGNTTTQAVAFVVAGGTTLQLSTTAPSGCDYAEVNLALPESESERPHTVNLKVTDLKGDLVWAQTAAQFPCKWNLTDIDGNRVQPGLYKIHANYEDEHGYGGSNIVNFVVLNPLNSNLKH